MVNLIQRWFCRKETALAVENEELKQIIIKLLPHSEKYLDMVIDIQNLKERLGRAALIWG